MKFGEYLRCAEKHLKGCDALLTSYQSSKKGNVFVWLELYYLSGYIMEGIAVYSAYKLNGWDPETDIQSKYDKNFTQQTGLDFYNLRIVNKKDKDKPPISFTPFCHDGKNKIKYSVQSHHFQEIIKNLLRPNPSFNGMPYFGDGEISSDVASLIDDWKPDVRYWYENQTKPLPLLNRDIIERLIKTCKTIYNDIRYRI